MPSTAPAGAESAIYVTIAVIAVSALVGAALVVWGRSSGRSLLSLLAAGIAAGSSRAVAEHLPYKNLWVIGISLAVAAGLLVFVLGRIVWALAFGAILGIAGVAVLTGAISVPDCPLLSAHASDDLSAWWGAHAAYLGDWLAALWRHNPLMLALAAGGPFLLGAVLGIVLPKLALVLGSSALGAAAIVAAGASGLLLARPEWMNGWSAHAYVPAGVAGLLAVTGLAFQTRAEIKLAARRRKEAEEKKALAEGAGSDRSRGR